MTSQPNFIQEAMDIITALGQNYRVSRLRFQLGGPGQVDLIMVTEPIKDNPVPLGEIPQHTRDWTSGTITLSTWDYTEAGVQSLVSRNRSFGNPADATLRATTNNDHAQGNGGPAAGSTDDQNQDKPVTGANSDHKYYATTSSDKPAGETSSQGPEAKRARGTAGQGFGGDNGWRKDLNTPECSDSKDYENITPPCSPLTPGAEGWGTESNLGDWSHCNPDSSRKPTERGSETIVLSNMTSKYPGVGRGKKQQDSARPKQPSAVGSRGRDPVITAAQAEDTEEGIPTFIVTGQDERAITAQAVMTPRVPTVGPECQDEITDAEAAVPLGLEGRALADQLHLNAVSIIVLFYFLKYFSLIFTMRARISGINV